MAEAEGDQDHQVEGLDILIQQRSHRPSFQRLLSVELCKSPKNIRPHNHIKKSLKKIFSDSTREGLLDCEQIEGM